MDRQQVFQAPSSSSSKKRPSANTENEENDIARYERSPSNNLRRTGIPLARPSPAAAGESTVFERRMKALRNKEFAHLNRELQHQLMELKRPVIAPDHPDHADLHQVEKILACYRMIASEITRRLGGETAGTLAAFGSNDTDQLGFDNLGNDNFPPSLVPSLSSRKVFRMVDCGGMHSVALAQNGVPWTWGCNDFGNLGRELSSDDEIGAGPVTGFVTNTGIKEDGCIAQVSAGESHTLFLSLDGNVYGTGMYKERDKTPFRITANPSEDPKGQNEKPQHMWQIQNKAILIYSGGDFAAAILEDRTMVTWGFGTTGELGRSADMASPNVKGEYDLGPNFYNPNGVLDKKVIREKFMMPQPPRFNWGSPKKTVLTVGCGIFHMLVVACEPGVAETNVYSTGHNGYGQLGHGDMKTRHELTLIRALEGENIAQVSGGEHFSLALCMEGKRLFSFGRSDKGMLGRGPPKYDKNGEIALEAVPKLVIFPVNEPVLIAHISAGDRHALAITPENEMYTWGFEGVTGHQVDGDIYYPTKLDLSTSLKKRSRAFHAAGGGQHSAAVVVRYG
ncbi:hypothetical protein ACA910_017172 [Epithemia clementina (nom. ined.)]